MTPAFKVERVLLYYDVPQVITLRDELNTAYLGFLLDDSRDDLPYIVAPVHPEAYGSIIAGRSTFWEGLQRSRELQCYLIDAVDYDLDHLVINRALGFSEVPSDYWPEEWAVLNVDGTRETSLARQYAQDGPVLVELAFDPPGSGVTIGHFTTLLTRFHHLVKSIAGLGRSKRQLLNLAVPAHAGSFKVLLEQAGELGRLYPDGSLSRALNDASTLIRSADSTDTLIGFFQTNAEAGSAFKNFVAAVRAIDTGITLRWEVDGQEATTATASRYQMQQLQDWLRGKYDAVTNQVSYKGTFTAMDLEDGKWRLADATVVEGPGALDDSTMVSGKTPPGSTHLLRHLVSGDVYTFTCSETTSLDPLTSEPSVERILKHVQERTQ